MGATAHCEQRPRQRDALPLPARQRCARREVGLSVASHPAGSASICARIPVASATSRNCSSRSGGRHRPRRIACCRWRSAGNGGSLGTGPPVAGARRRHPGRGGRHRRRAPARRGSSRPHSSLTSVVLPAPFAPTRAVVSTGAQHEVEVVKRVAGLRRVAERHALEADRRRRGRRHLARLFAGRRSRRRSSTRSAASICESASVRERHRYVVGVQSAARVQGGDRARRRS